MSDDYYRLRSTQIAEAVAADTPVIICLGATEQHGSHLPLGTDTYQVEELARSAIKFLDTRGIAALLGPSIPFGPRQFQCEAPVDFPGTIAISNKTMQQLLREVCAELIRHGFRRLYIVIGNAESDAPAQIAAKELSEETDAVVTTVNWMVVITELYQNQISFQTPQGHGGAGETARILAILPELVDLKASRAYHPKIPASNLDRDALPYLGGGIGRYKLPPDAFDNAFEGIVGAPAEATAEIGRQLFAVIGKWIADVIAFEEGLWTGR